MRVENGDGGGIFFVGCKNLIFGFMLYVWSGGGVNFLVFM